MGKSMRLRWFFILALVLLSVVLSDCGGGGSGDSSQVTPVVIPQANDDAFSVFQDSTLNGSVATNDIQSEDGGNSWSLVSSVLNGSLTFDNNGDFSYTPKPGYFGTDFFTYQIEDIDADRSETASVSIRVDAAEGGADPFINHQWALENIGQSALTTNAGGGVAGADVNLPDAGSAYYAQGFSGSGVKVAVIDNGVQIAHEDVQPNVVAEASYNFHTINQKGLHDPTAPDSVLNPDGHHGTAVAGLLAAKGGNGIGLWGVAPNANLVGYNLLYDAFNLTSELAALGFASAVESYPELSSEAVDIFNMSYGRNPFEGTNENASYTAELLEGIHSGTRLLRNGKGAIYVKAAGNEYLGQTAFTSERCSQANSNGLTCYNVNMEDENVTPYVLVIGAFNAYDQRASYSNTGSALWLVAPGGEFGVHSPALITTDASGCTYGYSVNNPSLNFLPYTSDFNTGESGSDNEKCNYFSAFNGSSSATPIVAGIAALLLEANPNLTWRDVKHILATTARQLDADLADNVKIIDATEVVLDWGWTQNAAGYAYTNHYGFGAPDANAAITMALNWKATNTTLPLLKAYTTAEVSDGRAVPDNNVTGLVSAVSVANEWITESVELNITIDDLNGVLTDSVQNKIDMSDYQIVLRSPSGTESVLLTPFNAYESGHDMIDLKLISHAFYGEPSQGEWTVKVRDLDNSINNRISDVGEGKLMDWSLKIYGR